MKILVTGAAGLLGSAVASEAGARGHEVVALGHADLDVTDADAVRRAIGSARPDAVVHCAAYTAVDRAESEPERARAVNVDGTTYVARATAEAGAALVYVSTDYVFDGKKRTPYLPGDEPGPLGVYAASKLEGERAAFEAPDALVVRSSWLYGPDKGFVPAILRRARAGEALRVVEDQRGRPTWVEHAAVGLLDLLEDGARGVWHVADRGECSWLDLAREALRRAGLNVEVGATTSAAYGAPARRPPYSVLDLEATEERLGRPMPDWRDGLDRFFRRDGAATGGGRTGSPSPKRARPAAPTGRS